MEAEEENEVAEEENEDEEVSMLFLSIYHLILVYFQFKQYPIEIRFCTWFCVIQFQLS